MDSAIYMYLIMPDGRSNENEQNVMQMIMYSIGQVFYHINSVISEYRDVNDDYTIHPMINTNKYMYYIYQ